MSYYEERLKKAELNCKYVEAGFFAAIPFGALLLVQGLEMAAGLRQRTELFPTLHLQLCIK